MKALLAVLTVVLTIFSQPWRVTELPDPSNREAVRATVVASAVEGLYHDTKDMELTETGIIYRGEALMPDSLHTRLLGGFYGDSLQDWYTIHVKRSTWSVFNLVYLTWKKYADKDGPNRKDCMEWLEQTGTDLGLESISDLKRDAREALQEWKKNSKSDSFSPISQ